MRTLPATLTVLGVAPGPLAGVLLALCGLTVAFLGLASAVEGGGRRGLLAIAGGGVLLAAGLVLLAG